MVEHKWVDRLILAAAAAALLWLGFHFLLPPLLPFLVAWGLSALLEPLIGLLAARRGLSRRWSAALCTGTLAAALAGGLGLLLWRAGYEVALLLGRLPTLLAGVPTLTRHLEDTAYRFLIALPVPMQNLARTWLEELLEQGSSLPSRFYDKLAQLAASAAAGLPQAGLFLFTALLACYFISADRPRLALAVRAALPPHWLDKLEELGGGLKWAVGGWFKAQLLLMLITFAQLAVGLLFLRVELALLAAGLIALLDALPLFGSGAALLPWAAFCLLGGHTFQGVGLLILWATVFLVRSLLEPKLVGKRVGLHPLVSLAAIYAGFRFFGVAGMILAPLAAVFLRQLLIGTHTR